MSTEAGLGRLLIDLLADLTAVGSAHARLAVREAGDQAREAARALLLLILGLLVAQVGLALAAAGIGLLVGSLLGHPGWGLLAASLVLLGVGAGVAVSARRRLASLKPMVETREELEESRRWLQEEALPTLRGNVRS